MNWPSSETGVPNIYYVVQVIDYREIKPLLFLTPFPKTLPFFDFKQHIISKHGLHLRP